MLQVGVSSMEVIQQPVGLRQDAQVTRRSSLTYLLSLTNKNRAAFNVRYFAASNARD